MPKSLLMVGLGEVLWDILPSGKVLGGAPANFAYMANILGDQGVIASRVGTDPAGQALCIALQERNLDTRFLQFDSTRRTGTAEVQIDATGQPTFTIGEGVAWDALEWTPAWEDLSRQADAICFGSLAQRSPTSASTIERFVRNARADALRIFDVNLRQSFYGIGLLQNSLGQANMVKLTDQELRRIGELLGLGKGDDVAMAKLLLREFDLKLVCVTRGARGSVLVSDGEVIDHSGVSVDVVDTVGAGDAFTACLACNYLRGEFLQQISDAANRFAAWMTTQVGAMPRVDPQQWRGIVRNGKGA